MPRVRIPVFAVVFFVFLLSNYVSAQEYQCDIPDLGEMSPGELKTKLSLTNYWQGSLGGVNTKNSDRINGLYDLDFFYLLGADGKNDPKDDYTLLSLSTQASFGYGISDSKVGSFFNINDGAKGDHTLIDRFYVEFTGYERLMTFNVGKIEIADIFNGNVVAHCEKDQFFAEPLVHNPSIPFPKHGLGIRVKYQPDEFWYAQAAVGDAQAKKSETGFNTTFHDEDYFFSIAEFGVMPNYNDLPGNYRFILWYDPQDKSYLDVSGRTKRDDTGCAVSFDQKIDKKTTLFFRYGWADDAVSEVEDFLSFGGQIEGLFSKKDIFAIGFAQGYRSPDALTSVDKQEINFLETYYKIKVTKNFEITPDFQIVMNPGGLKSESPATVLGLRCRLKF